MTKFHFEKYLTGIQNKKHKIALSRLRCSAHKLMVEEGKFRNIESHMNLCKFYNMNMERIRCILC